MRSAIIGRVTLVHVVASSTSRWFQGPYGLIFEDAEQIEPILCKGKFGIFTVDLTPPPRRAKVRMPSTSWDAPTKSVRTIRFR